MITLRGRGDAAVDDLDHAVEALGDPRIVRDVAEYAAVIADGG